MSPSMWPLISQASSDDVTREVNGEACDVEPQNSQCGRRPSPVNDAALSPSHKNGWTVPERTE